MKYRNTRTGAVIDSSCAISGGGWEPVKETKPKSPKSGKQESEPKQ